MASQKWHKIKEVFHTASSLPPDERPEFLERACQGDSDIRAEVERLLDSINQANDFLESPHDDFRPILGGVTNFDEMVAGQQIGPYQIVNVIGEGGMGVVYLARRADGTFKKDVAIKLIKRGMDTRTVLRRFALERQTLAMLNHPNIARLYDGGSTDDGLPYFVMEHIAGLPITKYCREKRLSIEDRLRLFRKVCAALSYAHRNLVIHRDLKPANILVDASGEAKLLDFGIAKLLSADEATATSEMTAQGACFVTPEYASPEQIKGQQVSTSSDVYALGILLYELLTGRRPYSFQNRSPLEIERTITKANPVPPSQAITPSQASGGQIGISAGKLSKKIKGDLDTILMKALQKEPDRRYDSVDQLSDDLRRHLEGVPIIARQDSTKYRVGKFIKRHRIGLAFLVAIFAALLAGIAGFSWQAEIARKEASKANQTLTFLRKMLSSADPLSAGRKLTATEMLDKAAERIPKELQPFPEIEGEIRSILGEAYQHQGDYDKAYEHFQANIELLSNHYGNNDPLVANGFRELAVIEHYRGNLTEADSLYRRALTLYRQIGETNSGDYAVAMNDFGTILLDHAQYDSAKNVFENSLHLMKQVFEKNHFQIGSALNNLAFVLDEQGDYTRADTVYSEALTVFRHNFGSEHPEIANSLNNLAFVKLNLGDTLACLQLHEEALSMQRKILGEDHPDIGVTLHNIAAVTFYKKEYNRAKPRAAEVIEIFSKHYPPDHIYLGSAYFLMGRILSALDEQDAEDYLIKTRKIRTAQYDASHPLIASSDLELGIHYVRNEKWKAAETALLNAHAFYAQAEGQEKNLRRTRTLLVEVYQKQGQLHLAAAYRKMPGDK